ncbi:MAG TPA: peroxidase-related enzyme [Saprospiraceae bacterium]|nr:peroxidase-related enzyme [Saprospiraceae bacterium]
MAHIDLGNDFPGIRGPMAFSPKTAQPMNDFANALLATDEGLSKGERELIGAYVSSLNDCHFCQSIHGAVANHYLGDESTFEAVKCDLPTAPVSEKMRALLSIAASVQKGGKQVTIEQIETARKEGATDRDIHDAVLIAAAFCMFNRYVDGLATWAPADPDFYRHRAQKVAELGYRSEPESGYFPPQ